MDEEVTEMGGQKPSESYSELKERLEKQLALLKSQIAQRKEAEEALRRESALVELLQEVTAAANQAETIEEAFQFALDKICDFTGWPLGHVYLSTGNGRQELVSSRLWYCDDESRYESFREVTESTRFEAGVGWMGRLFADGKPAWMLDVNEEPEFARARSMTTLNLRSGFAIPVMIGSQVAAVLEFFSPEPVQPDENLLQALTHIGSQLGRVIERVRAREELERHQTLLANAERLASLGSWEWDVREDRLTLSDETRRIYSLADGESCDFMEALLAAIHPDDREDVTNIIRQARVKGVPFYIYHRLSQPDEQTRTVLMHGRPERNEAGEVERMLGTSQDVTEQKQTEFIVARRAEQLSALSEMGQTVTVTLDLQTVFDKVLGKLLPLLGAAGVFILLLEGDELVVVAGNQDRGHGLKDHRVPVSAGVAGEVMRSGQPIGLYGEAAAKRVFREIAEIAGFRPGALLVAPLKLRGEIIGVMEAVHPEPHGLDDDDLQLLEAAASWTAIAISNARLFERQQKARQAAEMLRDANLRLTQSLELPTVLQTVLDHLTELIHCDTSSVKLKYGNRLVQSGVRGRELSNRTYNLLTLPEDHPLRLIADVGSSLLIRNTAVYSGWDEELGKLDQVKSWLGVPLLAGGRLIGVYTAGSAKTAYFTERHLLLAEALAGQAAIAVQNARLFDQVQATRDRLRYLTRQVVTAQEQERRRVSRELHDEAGQALTALKISLELVRTSLPADQASTRVQLAEATALVDETMEQIRLLAHNLRPPVLDSFGLNPSLEGFCEDFAQRTDLVIHYEGIELPALSDAAEISFYRFLQEALNNVAKHAGANEVWVRLRQAANMICLLVKDDGRGMERLDTLPGEAPRGVGLIGMQERFELLGGQLEINSDPGQGTEVIASVPLETSKQEDNS